MSPSRFPCRKRFPRRCCQCSQGSRLSYHLTLPPKLGDTWRASRRKQNCCAPVSQCFGCRRPTTPEDPRCTASMLIWMIIGSVCPESCRPSYLEPTPLPEYVQGVAMNLSTVRNGYLPSKTGANPLWDLFELAHAISCFTLLPSLIFIMMALLTNFFHDCPTNVMCT